jgi:hypothetical protein
MQTERQALSRALSTAALALTFSAATWAANGMLRTFKQKPTRRESIRPDAVGRRLAIWTRLDFVAQELSPFHDVDHQSA